MNYTRHLHIVITEDMDNWLNLRFHYTKATRGYIVREVIQQVIGKDARIICDHPETTDYDNCTTCGTRV